jgi:hypothetical protein
MFLNSHVRFDEIYDGSSHTLLIGELLSASDSLGWVSGTRSTLRNTGKIEVASPQFAAEAPMEEDAANKNVAESLIVGGFGSHHPGIVMTSFADGSTRSISETVDPAVWRLAGNRADGEIMKPF